MFNKKIYRYIALIVLLGIIISNPSISEAATNKATPKKITLNHSTYTLKKGKSVTLKVSVTPKLASKKDIIWKSSKKSVATVKDGTVTAKKKGNTKITAQVKGTKIKATCKITVDRKSVV